MLHLQIRSGGSGDRQVALRSKQEEPSSYSSETQGLVDVAELHPDLIRGFG